MENPTIKDVAQEAGVSAASISLYLNNKPGLSDATRERIARSIEKLGYVPRTQKMNHLTLIGLLVEKLPLSVFADIFYAEVVQGLESRARQLGYQTVLMISDSQENDGIPRAILEHQVEGLIALGGGDLTDELISRIAGNKIPVVLVDNYLLDGSVDCVLPDNVLGGYAATNYLIGKGHKRIAVIMGPAKYKPLTDRVMGYTRALLEAGLGPDVELMQPSLSSGVPNKGYREMRAILSSKELPTAVFCVSDRTAIGALMAIKEAGLNVPEDIALVGFDDTRDSEHTTPPLTTVRVPKLELGRVAIEQLDRRMNNRFSETPPLKLVLPTSVVERASA